MIIEPQYLNYRIKESYDMENSFKNEFLSFHSKSSQIFSIISFFSQDYLKWMKKRS